MYDFNINHKNPNPNEKLHWIPLQNKEISCGAVNHRTNKRNMEKYIPEEGIECSETLAFFLPQVDCYGLMKNATTFSDWLPTNPIDKVNQNLNPNDTQNLTLDEINALIFKFDHEHLNKSCKTTINKESGIQKLDCNKIFQTGFRIFNLLFSDEAVGTTNYNYEKIKDIHSIDKLRQLRGCSEKYQTSINIPLFLNNQQNSSRFDKRVADHIDLLFTNEKKGSKNAAPATFAPPENTQNNTNRVYDPIMNGEAGSDDGDDDDNNTNNPDVILLSGSKTNSITRKINGILYPVFRPYNNEDDDDNDDDKEENGEHIGFLWIVAVKDKHYNTGQALQNFIKKCFKSAEKKKGNKNINTSSTQNLSAMNGGESRDFLNQLTVEKYLKFVESYVNLEEYNFPHIECNDDGEDNDYDNAYARPVNTNNQNIPSPDPDSYSDSYSSSDSEYDYDELLTEYMDVEDNNNNNTNNDTINENDNDIVESIKSRKLREFKYENLLTNFPDLNNKGERSHPSRIFTLERALNIIRNLGGDTFKLKEIKTDIDEEKGTEVLNFSCHKAIKSNYYVKPIFRKWMDEEATSKMWCCKADYKTYEQKWNNQVSKCFFIYTENTTWIAPSYYKVLAEGPALGNALLPWQTDPLGASSIRSKETMNEFRQNNKRNRSRNKRSISSNQISNNHQNVSQPRISLTGQKKQATKDQMIAASLTSKGATLFKHIDPILEFKDKLISTFANVLTWQPSLGDYEEFAYDSPRYSHRNKNSTIDRVRIERKKNKLMKRHERFCKVMKRYRYHVGTYFESFIWKKENAVNLFTGALMEYTTSDDFRNPTVRFTKEKNECIFTIFCQTIIVWLKFHFNSAGNFRIWFILYLAVLTVYERIWGMKLHTLLVGKKGVGKTYIQQMIMIMLVTGTYYTLDEKSRCAFKDGATHLCGGVPVFNDELPPEYAITKGAKNTGDSAAAKRELDAQISERYVFAMSEDPDDSDSSKTVAQIRGTQKLTNDTSKVLSAVTNDHSLMDSALLDRFYTCIVADKMKNANVLDKPSGEHQIFNKMLQGEETRFFRFIQGAVAIEENLIMVGFPEPNMDIVYLLLSRVFRYLLKYNIPIESVRVLKRILLVCRVCTIIKALLTVFHTKGQYNEGKEFKMSMMLDLIPHMFCTLKICTFALFLLKDQFINPHHGSILKGLIQICAYDITKENYKFMVVDSQEITKTYAEDNLNLDVNPVNDDDDDEANKVVVKYNKLLNLSIDMSIYDGSIINDNDIEIPIDYSNEFKSKVGIDFKTFLILCKKYIPRLNAMRLNESNHFMSEESQGTKTEMYNFNYFNIEKESLVASLKTKLNNKYSEENLTLYVQNLKRKTVKIDHYLGALDTTQINTLITAYQTIINPSCLSPDVINMLTKQEKDHTYFVMNEKEFLSSFAQPDSLGFLKNKYSDKSVKNILVAETNHIFFAIDSVKEIKDSDKILYDAIDHLKYKALIPERIIVGELVGRTKSNKKVNLHDDDDDDEDDEDDTEDDSDDSDDSNNDNENTKNSSNQIISQEWNTYKFFQPENVKKKIKDYIYCGSNEKITTSKERHLLARAKFHEIKEDTNEHEEKITKQKKVYVHLDEHAAITHMWNSGIELNFKSNGQVLWLKENKSNKEEEWLPLPTENNRMTS